MRKQLFRHWKRETLEQVQIQGQQLDELQQAVVNLQNSINKMNSQRQTDDENHRIWEEEKIDSIFTADQQWQEGKIDAAFTANQQWQEGKIDAAFTANQQWQEAFLSNLQQWINEMTKGRINQILQNENQIKSMLETLWNTVSSKDIKSKLYYSLEKKTFIDQAERTLNSSFKRIKEIASEINKPLIMFIGDYVIFPNEAPRRYIEQIEKSYPEYAYLVMSEVSWFTEEETAKKISVPFHIVPEIIGAHYLSSTIEIPLSEEEIKQIENCEALEEASLKILKQNPKVTESYARFTVLSAYRYYTMVLLELKPKRLYIFNNFFYLHQIVEQVAKEQKINITYWEYGQVPGTFIMDQEGLFSTGYPVKHLKEFNSLPVEENDLEKAKGILKYLQNSKINRYQQSSGNELVSLISGLRENNKPIITYIDQIDGACGVYPDSERLRTDAFPCFSSCEDGLRFIADLCNKNGWQIIYKLHPIRNITPEGMPKNVHIIRKCDINELADNSDVIITGLSSVSFTAAVRNRPVVIIGRGEMSGKECAYEAFQKEIIEKRIQIALETGITEHMRQMLIQYIARMLKYYLYDDNQPRDMHYGRTTEQLIF